MQDGRSYEKGSFDSRRLRARKSRSPSAGQPGHETPTSTRPAEVVLGRDLKDGNCTLLRCEPRHHATDQDLESRKSRIGSGGNSTVPPLSSVDHGNNTASDRPMPMSSNSDTGQRERNRPTASASSMLRKRRPNCSQMRSLRFPLAQWGYSKSRLHFNLRQRLSLAGNRD